MNARPIVTKAAITRTAPAAFDSGEDVIIGLSVIEMNTKCMISLNAQA